MSNELIELKPETALEAFSGGDGLDAIISQAKNVVAQFDHDMSTKTSRARTASLAHKVARLKSRLDETGKELTAGWRKKASVVDASRRKMREELDALKTEARAPLTDWEAQEKLRVDNIMSCMRAVSDLVVFEQQPTLEDLHENLKTAQAQTFDEFYDEFQESAELNREKVVNQLTTMIRNEEQRLELDRLRKEKEEREEQERQAQLERERKLQQEREEKERKEREERLQREAAERAKREAEEHAKRKAERLEREKREAIERAERAEIERIKAEQRAKADAELAAEQARLEEKRKQAEFEAARKAEQRRAHLEQQRKEASKRHRASIEKAVLESFQAAGLLLNYPEDGLAIIKAIRDGKIAHVSINY